MEELGHRFEFPVKETLPNPNWPTWYNCNQILSASNLALKFPISSSSSPEPGKFSGNSSTLAGPPPVSAVVAAVSPPHSPLRWINFLLFLAFCRHRRPTIHGSLMRARAKKLTTEQGQQQTATQSATRPAVQDRQCLPEQSIKSAPSSTTNLRRRVDRDGFSSMFMFWFDFWGCKTITLEYSELLLLQFSVYFFIFIFFLGLEFGKLYKFSWKMPLWIMTLFVSGSIGNEKTCSLSHLILFFFIIWMTVYLYEQIFFPIKWARVKKKCVNILHFVFKLCFLFHPKISFHTNEE